MSLGVRNEVRAREMPGRIRDKTKKVKQVHFWSRLVKRKRKKQQKKKKRINENWGTGWTKWWTRTKFMCKLFLERARQNKPAIPQKTFKVCCSEQRLGISLSVWLDTWGHAPGHAHPHLQPWALPVAWPPSWEMLAFSSLNSRFRLRVVKSQYIQLLAFTLWASPEGGSYIINTLKLTGAPGAPYPVSSLPRVNHPSRLKEGL